ncbi:energy-coupling factor ABC transporter ATP-binding protein [Allorhizobium borbori]|uniref:Cobalt/nickel transport system ATP-binding protein n=1 Tax=Allorhizobium borbori TaxID=485907 RepID=A0A7W6P3J3_9HYPH|nr:ABC transporter ATP-binding protein [Allorhizobium borbori]MBB4105952.1 cobalt/nickel transport system ATP-binding protein [Allorhizobium borbori]
MTEPLCLQNLSVSRDGKAILDGIDLRLGESERLAIVGANGAGKTTLLRSIVGLEKPDAGDVILFGDVCKRERDYRAKRPRIGFLFQESDDQLFCPSVIEDVAFGPLNTGASEAEARLIAAQTLECLGIDHLAERFTHRLSGGEKRLVCLAGLLAMRPNVLLLDEPTNGVDAENGARLRAALLAFPGAIILVSHDDRFVAEIATRALILAEGRLKPAEIHDHVHSHRHPHIHAKPAP